MRGVLQSLALAVFLMPVPPAVAQQDETLADIRQELSVLYVELQRLKRELSTTGGADGMSASGGSLLDRVDAIESALQDLTAQTERLEFRIERVVRDGTNRLGDLEFRVCELDSDCDIAGFEPGSTLGSVADDDVDAGASAGAGDPDEPAGPQLAVSEQAQFDEAKAALEAGNHATAADLFAAFEADYPGGPLMLRARLLRGEALEQAGATNRAARAYLDTFSAAPNGPEAPEALYRLGEALGRMGKTDEACLTLGEVGARFPGGEAAGRAAEAMTRLGCS
ncbi:tol-pal system protein YbgF [Roseovarius sp. SYSU LYC5161]|uniref:tol-pal system protein YbgF n=1 Tax=Roseovarius halophilus (ex Wu et al. 2025) TaxID=3376060 RepID=UPI003999E01C